MMEQGVAGVEGCYMEVIRDNLGTIQTARIRSSLQTTSKKLQDL